MPDEHLDELRRLAAGDGLELEEERLSGGDWRVWAPAAGRRPG